jgi:hypothetical protein
MSIYKFVTWDVPALDTLKESTPYRIHEKLKRGEKLTDKERLTVASSTPFTCLLGWRFDFREWLTEYWVETRYYGIVKAYALDKTSIRKCGEFPGIVKIVEV